MSLNGAFAVFSTTLALILPVKVAAETQFERIFLERFVELALVGGPFDLVGLVATPTGNLLGTIRYNEAESPFVVYVQKRPDNVDALVTSEFPLRKRYSEKPLQSGKAWLSSTEEIQEVIASFEAFVEKHDELNDNARCFLFINTSGEKVVYHRKVAVVEGGVMKAVIGLKVASLPPSPELASEMPTYKVTARVIFGHLACRG